MGDREPDVAAAPPDRPGLHRPRGQHRAGGLMAWVNASRSVRTEMHSALLVGRQTIEKAIDRLQNAPDPHAV